MAMTKCATPFSGTAEQESQIIKLIHEIKDEKGSLMRILQEAQEIYGYLPIEVQTMIARELNIPLEKIYGVVTFYSQFSLTPKGKYQIAVCMGTACYVRGAEKIIDEFKKELGIPVGGVTTDGKFSLSSLRCVGACGLAPVVLVGEKTYGRVAPDDVKGILEEYK